VEWDYLPRLEWEAWVEWDYLPHLEWDYLNLGVHHLSHGVHHSLRNLSLPNSKEMVTFI